MTDLARLLAIAPNPSIDRLVEVEELRRGEIHRPAAVTVVAGGKGFNVARVAATLGAGLVPPHIRAGVGEAGQPAQLGHVAGRLVRLVWALYPFELVGSDHAKAHVVG